MKAKPPQCNVAPYQPTREAVQQLVNEMGAMIRKQRRRLGLALDDVAAAGGLSKPFLSLLENGRCLPSVQMVARLERALRFEPGELRALTDLIRTPPAVRSLLTQMVGGESQVVQRLRERP